VINNPVKEITITIPKNIAKDLAFYLSRSVFWDGDDCANIVAEEAAYGNGLAEKAIRARIEVLKKLECLLLPPARPCSWLRWL